MKVTTLRLPESMYEALESEANQNELSPSEYMRQILRNRQQITQANTEPNTLYDAGYDATEYEALEERVSKLEELVFESEPESSDLLEYVAENQPASKSDIQEACYPPDEKVNEDTWYQKQALPELKDSRFEYIHNRGWEE